MSPVAALLDQTLSPWVILVTLAAEWWATWFTLGRTALPTLLFTLAANGASLAVAALALASGALGPWEAPAAGEPSPGLLAWAGGWALVLGGVFVLEALVLRTLMRRDRPRWTWNPYDLLTYLAANAFTLAVAAGSLWWALRHS